ncbi:MAG: aminotransferase class I/II-fold pyridoxal phosphate-dependent enzyme [Solitalea-like symbiont of Acarus siro]
MNTNDLWKDTCDKTSIQPDPLVKRVSDSVAMQMFYTPVGKLFMRPIESGLDTEVIMNGKPVLMFGSNSYLGLTGHPKIKQAAIDAINKYGTGCAGSRMLNGTLDLHLELEDKLADFIGKQAAMLFTTGFQVNIGASPALADRNSYLIVDELGHASIIDAKRLSFAKSFKHRHNDMEHLDEVLSECKGNKLKLIISEGVFSMEGDIVKLPELVKVAKKHNAHVMIDDSHGIGILGNNGKGAADHFNLTDDTHFIMGTFSKTLASIGGFIAGDKDIINYLKSCSRSFIFSASMSPANTASVLAALEVIKEEPWRHEQLWKNTRYAIKIFNELGFDTGASETPIIPLYIRDNEKTFKLTMNLQNDGIFVNPVIHPATSHDSTLIRISLMATHTREQIDIAIDKIYRHSKSLNIL